MVLPARQDDDEAARVVPFPTRRAPRRDPPAAAPAPRQGSQDDDYRHRMMVNALALAVVIALMLAGAWMADQIVTLRKAQDCALAGRRCSPVEVPPISRF